MKKVRLVIFGVLFCLFLSAFGAAEGSTSIRVIENEDGSVHTIECDEYGNHLRETLECPDGTIIKQIYHEDGSRSERIQTPDDTIVAHTFRLNGSYSETCIDPNGNVRRFNYDQNGICISELGFLADGTSYEIYFDMNGTVISEMYKGMDGSEMQNQSAVNGQEDEPFITEEGTSVEREYDEYGRLTETVTAGDGTVYIHFYDENGNHVREICSMTDGTSVEHHYDENGNHIREIYTTPDGASIEHCYDEGA